MIPRIKIAISKSCQLSCFYCGGCNSVMENFETHGRTQLSIETLERILRAYANAGGKGILLTGGEPLLNPDLDKVLRLLVQLGLQWEITTNGLALNAEAVDLIARHNPTVVKVSLDTADRSLYEQITGVNGLETVTRNVSAAVKYFPIRINAVVTRRTLIGVPTLIALGRALGVQAIFLLDLIHYPEYNRENASYQFEDEYVDLRGELAPLLEEAIGVKWNPADFYELSKVYWTAQVADSLQLAIKQGKETTRVTHCATCPTLCQEGAFVLRLSVGGWLNFCPLENSHGVAIGPEVAYSQLVSIFQSYGTLFDTTHVVDTWSEFISRVQR